MGNTTSSQARPLSSAIPGGESEANHPKPAKRQPQKLSKPRVGNHSSSNTPLRAARRLSSNAPSATSSTSQLPEPPNRGTRRRSTLQSTPSPSPAPPAKAVAQANSVTAQEKEKQPLPPPPIPQEEPRRLSLFRSKSSQEDRKSKRRSLHLAPPMPGDRLSRANSLNWESQANLEYARSQVESGNVAGNRRSAKYDMTFYEASRTLGQTEAPLSPVPGTVISASGNLEVTPEDWKIPDDDDDGNTRQQISRVGSETSLFASVRRRSVIQTPGLATRKMDEQAPSRKTSQRRSFPPTPVLASVGRQDSVDSMSSRVMSLPPPPKFPSLDAADQVQTPPEGEYYRQLGDVAFGSLRITNGAASPIPSIRDEIPSTDSSSWPPQRIAAADGESQPPTEPAAMFPEESNNSISSQSERTTALGSDTSGWTDSAVLGSENVELPSSPKLETTSKHTAAEDHLLDDDEDTPEYASDEVLDVREDPNAHPKIERPRVDPAQRTPRGLERADSGIVASPMSEKPPKSLSKTDSGYSSNVSLRSISTRRKVGTAERRSSSAAERLSREKPSKPDSVATQTPALGSPTGTTLVVDAMTFDLLTAPCSPTKDISISLQSSEPGTSLSPQPPELPLSPGSTRRGRETQPLPLAVNTEHTERLSPMSPTSNGAFERSSSALSIGSNSNKERRGKFHKLFRGLSTKEGVPSVHLTHSVEKTVPAVPQDVEAKLREHAGQYPMTTKRLALHNQPSKDTLKTILSVGSVEPGQADNVQKSPRLPEEIQSEDTETTKASRRSSVQSAVSLISRSSLRRKPVGSGSHVGKAPPGQNDLIPNGFESHVTSIDSIRDSVGRSAFDQAFAPTPSHNNEVETYLRRSMTMDPHMQREMERRRHSVGPRAPVGRFGPPARSSASPIPEVPGMSPSMVKPRTPPPVSMTTRGSKRLRKKPSSRAQSTPPALNRKPASRSTSLERERSPASEASTVPPVPPMNPEQAALYPEFQHLRRPGPVGSGAGRAEGLGRQDSASSRGPNPGQSPGFHRPASASSLSRKQLFGDLRSRASLESLSGSRGRGSGLGPPRPRPHPTTSQNPTQSGSYYQNQLLQLQDQHWGGEGWSQPGRYPSHGGPAVRHFRHRSTGHRLGPNPPYRILHSYNSPAYRNAPIWG